MVLAVPVLPEAENPVPVAPAPLGLPPPDPPLTFLARRRRRERLCPVLAAAATVTWEGWGG